MNGFGARDEFRWVDAYSQWCFVLGNVFVGRRLRSCGGETLENLALELVAYRRRRMYRRKVGGKEVGWRKQAWLAT